MRTARPVTRAGRFRHRRSRPCAGGRPVEWPGATAIDRCDEAETGWIPGFHWATDIITLATSSPVAVVVSTPRSTATDAQPSRAAVSRSEPKSTTLLVARSSLATTRASAWPAARSVRAADSSVQPPRATPKPTPDTSTPLPPGHPAAPRNTPDIQTGLDRCGCGSGHTRTPPHQRIV